MGLKPDSRPEHTRPSLLISYVQPEKDATTTEQAPGPWTCIQSRVVRMIIVRRGVNMQRHGCLLVQHRTSPLDARKNCSTMLILWRILVLCAPLFLLVAGDCSAPPLLIPLSTTCVAQPHDSITSAYSWGINILVGDQELCVSPSTCMKFSTWAIQLDTV